MNSKMKHWWLPVASIHVHTQEFSEPTYYRYIKLYIYECSLSQQGNVRDAPHPHSGSNMTLLDQSDFTQKTED